MRLKLNKGELSTSNPKPITRPAVGASNRTQNTRHTTGSCPQQEYACATGAQPSPHAERANATAPKHPPNTRPQINTHTSGPSCTENAQRNRPPDNHKIPHAPTTRINRGAPGHPQNTRSTAGPQARQHAERATAETGNTQNHLTPQPPAVNGTGPGLPKARQPSY